MAFLGFGITSASLAGFDLASVVNFKLPRSIGGIVAQATVEERHFDQLEVTSHPVEYGAEISDHSFKRPGEVVITCGWSNSSLEAAAGFFGAADLVGGSGVRAAGNSFVRAVYAKLLKLQASRQVFDVLTGKRAYKNMLMTSIGLTTDEKTENALLVTVTCREIIIAYTQATTLPSRENLLQQQSTAPVTNTGTKQVARATPSPGGASPPSAWGAQNPEFFDQ